MKVHLDREGKPGESACGHLRGFYEPLIITKNNDEVTCRRCIEIIRGTPVNKSRMHFKDSLDKPICNAYMSDTWPIRLTDNGDKVTCKRCLGILKLNRILSKNNELPIGGMR